MSFFFLSELFAKARNAVAKNRQLWLGAAAVVGGLLASEIAMAQRGATNDGLSSTRETTKPPTIFQQSVLSTVAFDDFENLHPTMLPFTLPANVFADGTDYSTDIRSGTAREWIIDNSQMGAPAGSLPGGVCEEPGYNGWTAMDVASWTAEQGSQIGRTTLGLAARNTALVADPDAYYDFDNPGQPGLAYHSYIYRDYDLTGFDETDIEISFDYEFAIENAQRGTVEVSFDGGGSWTLILDLVKGALPNDTILLGPATIPVVGTSSTMRLRIGCIDASNNWWFAVDNVHVTTGDGFDDFEDFEGLPMVSFLNAPPGAQPPTSSRFDGTDFTNVIPNWTIDNSQMLGICLEAGYDGWNAMDVRCWVNEQGGQGRSLFDFGVFNANSVLVCDPDAFYDYDVDLNGNPPAPANGFNSYITRTYDLSDFDNCTLQISMEYECRVENNQRGTIEVSFDGGTTWLLLADLIADPDNGIPNGTTLLGGPAVFVAGSEFTPLQSNTMKLRIGCTNADNNWWFAVDNILVEAETIDFVKGDASGDNTLDFLDVDPFVLALLDPVGYANQFPNVDPAVVLDFNCDGQFSFLDIDGFINVLFGN